MRRVSELANLCSSNCRSEGRRILGFPSVILHSRLKFGVPLPGLFDVGVGHAGYVIGYCAWEALFADACLVVKGEQLWVSDPCGEEGLDDFFGVGVFCFQCWGQVEIRIKIALRLTALFFHFWAQGCDAARGVAQILQSFNAKAAGLPGDMLHEVCGQGVEHLLEGFVG